MWSVGVGLRKDDNVSHSSSVMILDDRFPLSSYDLSLLSLLSLLSFLSFLSHTYPSYPLILFVSLSVLFILTGAAIQLKEM